ncbi:ribbon-helix-helix protein, CopG family [Cryobacterium sp. GrIS_2_6]|uniref:ribbon-helix-helix protein, CopG family n=1 Tax=Cryobacterium sp. GrIS_2_6 TaxID=3162785 RepID=UPI002E0299FF|nr:ribbon-helix-helix protein, CopG family [Cryobacterium psychrotolerans]MEC5152452.1 putative transcriptional regulator [Cryobacterium psychrotolerans]
MSEASGLPQFAGASSQMRTLAVRITDDLRAQLDVIAQLNDRSVTEEIRVALENWIERSKSDPQVLKRAETVRADIEREAQTKRNAIEAIFAKEPTKKVTPPSRDAAKDKTPGN